MGGVSNHFLQYLLVFIIYILFWIFISYFLDAFKHFIVLFTILQQVFFILYFPKKEFHIGVCTFYLFIFITNFNCIFFQNIWGHFHFIVAILTAFIFRQMIHFFSCTQNNAFNLVYWLDLFSNFIYERFNQVLSLNPTWTSMLNRKDVFQCRLQWT